MTIFEYLMVLVSIVLALGLTQLLRGFGKIARSARRHAPLTLWALTLALHHVQVWWALWDFRQVDAPQWTQFSFLYMVLLPASLYAATDFLVPAHTSRDTDWEAHFRDARRWFYGSLAAFQIIATTITRVLLDVPLLHPYRVVQVTLVGIALAGFFIARRSAQLWLAATFLSVFLGGQLLFRLFLTGL